MTKADQSVYDAFYAGQLACYDGALFTANPYEGATYLHYAAWREGWLAEDATKAQRTDRHNANRLVCDMAYD